MTEEKAPKSKIKVTVTARIKRAGTDEWVDIPLDEEDDE